MTHGVLIIEDEITLAKNIERSLKRHGYEVEVTATGAQGLRRFESFMPDLVLLDYRLADVNGLEVLNRIRAIDGQAKVIIMTAHGNVDIAVQAMKAGACDYLTKPVALSELRLMIDKAIGQQHLERSLDYYRNREAAGGLGALIGESPAMIRLKSQVRQVIAAEQALIGEAPPPVLITGETGTGKELVARALHFDGLRHDRSFIEINCTALPAHLVEAELFGYERGAFTDAKTAKPGLVEAADGGTLFLDEIGEIEPSIQVKLLKLLEDRSVRRIGSVRDRKVDLRIITATNRSLETLIERGEFRADLYFRLRIIGLSVPPLRERDGDILLLARHFLEHQKRRYGKPQLHFAPETERALTAYAWPGNVRELRNLVEQAVLLATEDTIRPHQLPLLPTEPGAGSATSEPALGAALPSEGLRLADHERDLLVQALERAQWNVTGAARLLGVSRDTLRYRMEKFDLKRPG